MHCFIVVGAVSPDLPLRVLNLFAQQALAVEDVHVRRVGELYDIRIALAGLTSLSAGIILEKIRGMVLVERAELSCLDTQPVVGEVSEVAGIAGGARRKPLPPHADQ